MNRKLFPPCLALLCLFFLADHLMAQTTSTLSAETSNNTSVGSFPQHGNGNVAAGHVSKLPTRSLLYSGATTKVYAHFQPWFCMPGTAGTDGIVRCGGHITTGYNSNDAAQVKKQIDDMIARGIDGLIVNWYGKNHATENNTTLKVMQEAQSRSPLFEFAVMEDFGAAKSCADPTQCMIDDLNYAATTYYPSPAYMHRSGRPVVLFFASTTDPIDWNRLRANVTGNPYFIFEDSFTRTQSDGAFSWVKPGIDNVSYLDNFYHTAQSNSGKPSFGSGSKGFDDRYATWTGNRFIDQACGSTWVNLLAQPGAAGYSASNQLANLELVTWNDFDEGTEIESGIDNCLSVTASVSTNTLSWTLSGAGQESTVDRYRIWSSPAADGQNLTLRSEVTAGGAHSADLTTLGLTAGTAYTIYVQAVGRPSILDHMSNGVAYTAGGNPPPRAVNVSSPVNNSSVISSIHVVASESTGTATDMQIYRDGTLVYDQAGVTAIDTNLDVGCGAHAIAVKAWYADGTNKLTTVNITVTRSNLVTSPTAGSTVTSPVHVVSTSCSDHPVTSTQIYLDNVLNTQTSTSSLDQSIAMSSGSHCIVGKGWDSAGNSFRTVDICFTVQ